MVLDGQNHLKVILKGKRAIEPLEHTETGVGLGGIWISLFFLKGLFEEFNGHSHGTQVEMEGCEGRHPAS